LKTMGKNEKCKKTETQHIRSVLYTHLLVW
jgi:hypothetical protein